MLYRLLDRSSTVLKLGPTRLMWSYNYRCACLHQWRLVVGAIGGWAHCNGWNRIYIWVILEDALKQVDLEEQLGLSALLKGTSTDYFHLVGSGIRTSDLSVTVLTAKLPAARSIECCQTRCFHVFGTIPFPPLQWARPLIAPPTNANTVHKQNAKSVQVHTLHLFLPLETEVYL
jgi:hypothetical protein